MVLYIALLAVFTTAALMRLYWDGKCTPFNAPASWLVLRHCAALGAPESTMPSFRLLRYLLLLGWLSFQVHNPSVGSECPVIISVTSSVSWRLKLDSLCHSCDSIRPWPAFQISEKVPGTLGQGTSEIIDERARHWCCHVLLQVLEK